jgi:hypothetical protein
MRLNLPGGPAGPLLVVKYEQIDPVCAFAYKERAVGNAIRLSIRNFGQVRSSCEIHGIAIFGNYAHVNAQAPSWSAELVHRDAQVIPGAKSKSEGQRGLYGRDLASQGRCRTGAIERLANFGCVLGLHE